MKNTSIGLRLGSSQQPQKKYHFSVDDVFDSLIEVTDRGIPLKEHIFFAILWDRWKKYGLKTGLYLFYQKDINGSLRTLKEVRDISDELKDEWLMFGPHAFNPMTPPYSQSVEEQKFVFDGIYQQIERFAGNYRSNYVRLHYYSESYELGEYFKGKGVRALFTTDKSAGSHRMPNKNRDELIGKGCTNYNQCDFIRTNFRVEILANESLNYEDILSLFTKTIDLHSDIVIYAHEYEFQRAEVCDMFNLCIDILEGSLNMKSISP